MPTATPLAAQTGNASVSGRVKDASGAVIPGASIAVKNTETNVVRSTESNAEGNYTITNLIPGSYTLSATFQGFKNLEQGPFTLRVGDRVTVELAMEVGAQSERVSVTAEKRRAHRADRQPVLRAHSVGRPGGGASCCPYVVREAFRLPQTLPNNVEIGDIPSAFSDLRDPGFSQWDFSVLKNFPFAGESRYVQFRMEAQNFFNHMNAGGPARASPTARSA